jgi:NitT/TauT family transport system substrate-binding protein
MMPRVSWRHVALAGLCAGLALVGGCRRPEPKLTPFTISFQSWVGYGPLYLAKDKDFFKDEGIDVILVEEHLDSERNEAFMGKMLDAEAGTLDMLVRKRVHGVPVVGVCPIDFSDGGDGIVATKDIRSLKDLKGRRVSFTAQDTNDTFLSYALKSHGLSPKDIRPIFRDTDNVADAFLSDAADAAATWEPWLSMALKRPGAHLLVTSKEIPGVIVDMLHVREDVVSDHPELVRGFLRAWFKALDLYRRDPDAAAALIAPRYGLDAKGYQAAVSKLRWLDRREATDPKTAALLTRTAGMFPDLFQERASADRGKDAGKILDFSLMEAAP